MPKFTSLFAATNPLLRPSVEIPDGFVSLYPIKVPPAQSKTEEYCWVYHPRYGFYFIEGVTNYHFRFFKGDGAGNSRTEVMPNRLYDDCNRGYTYVDRNDKTVQIQTAALVKDYLDFVPEEVVAGFKKAFPGYEVSVKGSKVASKKVALDALLETFNDEERATHQQHADPDFTTQNGKMMGKGREVEEGALDAAIPARLLASRTIPTPVYASMKVAANLPEGYEPKKGSIPLKLKWVWSRKTGPIVFSDTVSGTTRMCMHSFVCAENNLQYDESPKGYIYIDPNKKKLRISTFGGDDWGQEAIQEEWDITDGVDSVIDELKYMYPLEGYSVEVTSTRYQGIYSDPEAQTKSAPHYDLHEFASKKAATTKVATNWPTGFKPKGGTLPAKLKWVWSRKTGPIVFNNNASDDGRWCVHGDICQMNNLGYDVCPKGYIYSNPLAQTILFDISRGSYSSADLTDAVDNTIDELKDLYPIAEEYEIKLEGAIGDYYGIYRKPVAESLYASKKATKSCVACECGECIVHPSTVNDLTNAVVTSKPPVESVIDDATFFKESEDEFEISRTASGQVILADTKSYGTGTPIGGTPNASKPSTPPSPEMTPEQRLQDVEQDALTPTQPPQTTPPQAGTPQQPNQQMMQPQGQLPLQQGQQPVMQQQPVQAPIQQGQLNDALAQLVKLTLARVADKNTEIAPRTIMKTCAEELGKAGYAVKSCLGSEGIKLTITHKTGSKVDAKDVTARVNSVVHPNYSVTATITQKDSPDFLPPRDDMRRHLDEEEKAEVMEGVHDPAPRQPSPAAPPLPPQQPPQQLPMTKQQELLDATLASSKTGAIWEEDDDDDDDGPDGAYGTMYGKPLGRDETYYRSKDPKDRLEYLRRQLRAECISQSELMELESLAEYIEPGDVELLEAAGVPENDNTMYCDGCQEPGEWLFNNVKFRHKPTCKHVGKLWDDRISQWTVDHFPLKSKRFRPTDKDKKFMREVGIKVSSLRVTDVKCNECGNFVEEGICSGCGDFISTHCDANISAVMCQDCGKWFGNICGCMNKDPGGNVCNACLAHSRNNHRIAYQRVPTRGLDAPEGEYPLSNREVRRLVNPSEYELIPALSEQEPFSMNPNPNISIQTKEGVNLTCPGCTGNNVKKVDGLDAEDGSLVECVDCGCFFAV